MAGAGGDLRIGADLADADPAAAGLGVDRTGGRGDDDVARSGARAGLGAVVQADGAGAARGLDLAQPPDGLDAPGAGGEGGGAAERRVDLRLDTAAEA